MGIQSQTSVTILSKNQHIEKRRTSPSPSSPPSWHFPMPSFGRLDHALPSQKLSHHLSQRGTWVTGIPCMRLPCPSQPGKTRATAGSTDPSHKGSTTSASTSPPPTQTQRSWVLLLVHGCSQLPHEPYWRYAPLHGRGGIPKLDHRH